MSPSSDYKEYHTDTTVRFVVYMTADKVAECERIGFHKKFKLETYLNTSNLVYTCTEHSPKLQSVAGSNLTQGNSSFPLITKSCPGCS